jgi:drug/metabolite transporter (DMT)-like permease
MKELITLDQANQLMLAALVIIPIIGLIIGFVAKRIKAGVAWGLAVGIGNLVLWKVYNAITDRLGLDTVKNLLVNLALFIVVGLAVGLASGLVSRRRHSANGGGAPTESVDAEASSMAETASKSAGQTAISDKSAAGAGDVG